MIVDSRVTEGVGLSNVVLSLGWSDEVINLFLKIMFIQLNFKFDFPAKNSNLTLHYKY